MRAASFACLLAVVLATASSGARAQGESETADPPAEYTELIEEGLAESSVQHWAEARAIFRRAHALHPNARTLRAIGMTSYELRDYPEAYRMFRAALVDTRRPLTEAQRAEVQGLLDRTESLLGRYTLEAFPADASIRVDGVVVMVAPGDELLLQPGVHRVDVRWADERAAGEWTVQGGEHGPLPVTSVETNATVIPTTTPASSAARVDEPMSPVRRRRIVLGISTSVVGVAVAGLGGAFFARGQDDIANVEDSSAGTPWSSVADDYETGPRRVRAGATVLGVGLAIVAGGIVLATVSPREDRTITVRAGAGTLSTEVRF